MEIDSSYTGSIGLPKINGKGDTSYYEYRETYLKISATTVNIGRGTEACSGRIKLNTGTNATTINVFGTSQPNTAGTKALLWVGVHASNVMNVYQGSIGVAMLAAETATLPTLRLGFESAQNADVDMEIGSGATLTTITKNGGSLILNSGATTITQTSGTLVINGSGAYTTITLSRGGSCVYNSSGTITTLNVIGTMSSDEPIIDFSRDLRSKTVTTTNRYGTSTIRDTNKVVTFTNGIDLEQSNLAGIDLGDNINIARGAVS